MKRLKLIFVLVAVLSFITIFSMETFAAAPSISIVVNNNKLNFPDAKPFVDKNGRTQTPAKYIGEALGATVVWNGKEQKAVFTFSDTQLVLYIGKKDYTLNGQTKQMDTTAVLKDGRTFVPAKYIAEAFGATIKWDGETNTVYVDRTLKTQIFEGKDVPDGTIVSNQAELHEAMKLATYTLQTKVVLKCDDYFKSNYDLEKLFEKDFLTYGAYVSNYKTTYKNNVLNLTATITYFQGFEIEQGIKNELALSRLSEDDTTVVTKINEIISQIIDDNMSDYQKELAIHNYLVQNFKYDYDNYLADTLPDESYTPYGLLVKGTGVCQAYAETMKLMLNAVGVDCEVVFGTSEGISHAWNIVKLDNEYYMLDTTWDDPTPDREGEVFYNYFNVTSAELSKDHIWEESNWPKANGTKYNYFIYNNLVVNNYYEFKQLVVSQILEGKKVIWVYINGYDKNTYDLQFIFDFYSGSSIGYYVKDSINTPFRIILK